MILTEKNTIANRYIRKKITQYKQKKAQLVTSDMPIVGADIPKHYHEKFVQERLAECAGFTKELVEGRMFRDKKDREIAAIKSDLERLRNQSSK